MKPHLFDIHCHLNFSDFNKDRDEVIKRALDAGVWMINIGSDFENSKMAVEIAENYKEGVYASVGIHPHDTENLGVELPSGFEELARHPKVVAIGETGLDFYRNREIRNPKSEIRNKQEKIFKQQIELALEINKPLMIHCRDAHDDILKILNTYYSLLSTNYNGNIHFFSGNLEQAQKYFDLGFSISFTGVLTYDVGRITDIVSRAPLEKIMIETDAPFARPLTPERSDGGRVAPVPFRGKRNEPLYVQETAKRIAKIRGLSYEKVAEATTKNALNFFRI